MVLTNFECWAHGMPNAEAADVNGAIGVTGGLRHVDLFNPRAVQQALSTQSAAVSHISSNGYYGFSSVNAEHELNNKSSNNNNNNNAETTITPKNNGTVGNNVHGMMQTNDVGAPRCKKRCFVSDDDYNFSLLNNSSAATSGVEMKIGVAAKRCRFDDDNAAQYCNDLFNLTSTQIGTQSCIMDTEDYGIPQQQMQQQQQFHTLHQQQQPQVDVAMATTYATAPPTTTQNNFINNSQKNYEDNSCATCITALDSFSNTFPIKNNVTNNNNVNELNDEELAGSKIYIKLRNQHLQNHNINNCCQHVQSGAVQMNSISHSDSATVAADDDDVVADAASMFATTHGGSTYQFIVAAHPNFDQEADI